MSVILTKHLFTKVLDDLIVEIPKRAKQALPDGEIMSQSADYNLSHSIATNMASVNERQTDHGSHRHALRTYPESLQVGWRSTHQGGWNWSCLQYHLMRASQLTNRSTKSLGRSWTLRGPQENVTAANMQKKKKRSLVHHPQEANRQRNHGCNLAGAGAHDVPPGRRQPCTYCGRHGQHIVSRHGLIKSQSTARARSKKCDQGEKDPATTETQIRRKRTGSQSEGITDMNA